MQLIVTKAEQMYDNEDFEKDPDLAALPKLSEMLQKLAKKFSDMDLNDMNFEKHADYGKSTVQGQVNAMRVESMKNCYEALMEYLIHHGAGKENAKAGMLLALNVRHEDLRNLVAKNSSAAAKKAKKAKKDQTLDDTIQKAKAPNAPDFTLPEHAISLKAISVLLNMILL